MMKSKVALFLTLTVAFAIGLSCKIRVEESSAKAVGSGSARAKCISPPTSGSVVLYKDGGTSRIGADKIVSAFAVNNMLCFVYED